jgi:hypothetical protein
MHNEIIQSADVCSATVDRGASHNESVQMHGRYHVVCHGADGALKWEEVIDNIVTTVGKTLTITGALTNAAQGVSYMGLKGAGTAVVGDTQASPGAWLEVGATNAPTYTSPRKTPTWGTASAGAISPTAAQVFAMTGSGTVAGCFINVGGTSAIDNTTGTLFSDGDFTAGSKTVTSGDTLSVTYTATAA